MNTLELIDNCPGWDKAKAFLQSQIILRGARRIAEVGGGENPMVDAEFVGKNGLEYRVLVDGMTTARPRSLYGKPTLRRGNELVGRDGAQLLAVVLFRRSLRAWQPAASFSGPDTSLCNPSDIPLVLGCRKWPCLRQ